MQLIRLVYYSHCQLSNEADLENILASARRNNARNKITGALWFDGDYFVQALEGGRRAVSQTYHAIAADPRHSDIELVSCGTVDTRSFHTWKMGYFADTTENRALVLKHSGSDKLEPRNLADSGLLKILAEGELAGS